MKSIFTLAALFIVAIVMAQNTDKENNQKHPQDQFYQLVKGFILWEDFESGTMPPPGWQLQSGTTQQTWDTASFDPYWGTYYALCKYDESLIGNQDEYLISRVMNMQTFSTAVLTFYFQFSQYWGIYPEDNYDLYVLASIDSAQTFPDTIWSELNTDTSAWISYQWVMGQLDLSSYIGLPEFARVFVYSGIDGAEAALDDISIQTTGGFEENNLHISVYPNPASEILRINSSEKGQLVLSDFAGRMMYSEYFSGNVAINVSSIPAGLYLLTLTTENGTAASTVEIAR